MKYGEEEGNEKGSVSVGNTYNNNIARDDDIADHSLPCLSRRKTLDPLVRDNTKEKRNSVCGSNDYKRERETACWGEKERE